MQPAHVILGDIVKTTLSTTTQKTDLFLKRLWRIDDERAFVSAGSTSPGNLIAYLTLSAWINSCTKHYAWLDINFGCVSHINMLQFLYNKPCVYGSSVSCTAVHT